MKRNLFVLFASIIGWFALCAYASPLYADDDQPNVYTTVYANVYFNGAPIEIENESFYLNLEATDGINEWSAYRLDPESYDKARFIFEFADYSTSMADFGRVLTFYFLCDFGAGHGYDEMVGWYSIDPRAITLNGQQIEVTIQNGRTYGTPDNPVILNVSSPTGISIPQSVTLKSGEKICLERYYDNRSQEEVLMQMVPVGGLHSYNFSYVNWNPSSEAYDYLELYEEGDEGMYLIAWAGTPANGVQIPWTCRTFNQSGVLTVYIEDDWYALEGVQFTSPIHMEADDVITLYPESYLSLIPEGFDYRTAEDFEWDFTFTLSNQSSMTAPVANLEFDGAYWILTSVVEGTATLTATYNPDPSITASTTLYVGEMEEQIPVTGIEATTTETQILWVGNKYSESFDFTSGFLTLDGLYTISPADATNQNVTWKSSNTSVVSCGDGSNEFGTYAEAEGVGTATLTATTVDGGFTTSINIEVRSHVQSVSLTNDQTTLAVGETLDLSTLTNVTPANAYDKSVTWTSLDADIVSVSMVNGKPVATVLSAGSATLKAVSNDNPDAETYLLIDVPDPNLCTIWLAVSKNGVLPQSEEDYYSLNIVAYADGMQVGNTYGDISQTGEDDQVGFFKMEILPNDANALTGKTLTFVLEIYEGGDEAQTAAPFFSPVGRYLINPSDIKLQGATTAIKYQGSRNWGTPEVPVILNYIPLTSVTCPDTYTLTVGETLNVNDIISYTPSNASMPYEEQPVFDVGNYVSDFDWESSNPGVIHATTPTPDFSLGIMFRYAGWEGPISINVQEQTVNVTGIEATTTETQILWVGNKYSESFDFTSGFLTLDGLYTITPADATNQDVTWTSSNPSVVSWGNGSNEFGTYAEAEGVGTATLTATTVDGGFTTSINIEVRSHVQSVSLTNDQAPLAVGETLDLSTLTNVTPANAYDKSVTWTSLDADIVSVSMVNGKPVATALSVGATTLSVVSNDNPDATGTMTVTVSDPHICTYIVTVTANHETFPVRWGYPNEYNYIQVIPYIDGTPASDPIECTRIELESPGATAPQLKCIYTVPIDDRLYKDKAVEFHIITNYDTEIIGLSNEIEMNTLPLSGEFIIRDVSWENYSSTSQMPVTGGATWGTTEYPIDLCYVIPETVTTTPSSINLSVGGTFDLSTVTFNFLPGNSTVPVNPSPMWEASNASSWMTVTPAVEGGSPTILTAIAPTPEDFEVRVFGSDDNFSVSIPVTIQAAIVNVTGIEATTTETQILWVGNKYSERFDFTSGFLTLDGLYTVTPADATNPDVTWKSSDTSVVSCGDGSNEFGTYAEAEGVGTATLTATTVDGGFTTSINIEVRSHVQSVSLTNDQTTLTVGETLDLSTLTNVTPANAYDKSVTWTSLDAGIVTVSMVNGKPVATALSAGSATLKAVSNDNPDAETYLLIDVPDPNLCTIWFAVSNNGILPPSEDDYYLVNILAYADGMLVGDTYRDTYNTGEDGQVGFYKMEILPNNASALTGKTLTFVLEVFEEEDESKTTAPFFSPVGRYLINPSDIKLQGATTAIKYQSGRTWGTPEAPVFLNYIPLTSVTCPDTYALTVGESLNVNDIITYTPSNASMPYEAQPVFNVGNYISDFDWESANPGVIHATTPTPEQGMTIQYRYANWEGPITIIVNEKAIPVTGIEATTTETQVLWVNGTSEEQSLNLKELYRIVPSDAKDQDVTWTSSDTRIVDISPNLSNAIAKSIGTATLTVTTKEGGFSANINVEVRKHVESIEVVEDLITLNPGTVTPIDESLFTVLPLDAYDRTVELTLTNDSAHCVSLSQDSNGNWQLTAHYSGVNDLLIASPDNYKVYKYIHIVVKKNVTGIQANSNETQILWINGKPEEKSVILEDLYTILPPDATNKNTWWMVPDSGRVVSMYDYRYDYGYALAVANSVGKSIVTVVTEDGEYSVGLNFEVRAHVESIDLSKYYGKDISLPIGSTLDLSLYKPDFTPTKAYDKSLTWTSGDESIATVSMVNGKPVATGVSLGTCYLKAVSNDNPEAESYLWVEVTDPNLCTIWFAVSNMGELPSYWNEYRYLTIEAYVDGQRVGSTSPEGDSPLINLWQEDQVGYQKMEFIPENPAVMAGKKLTFHLIVHEGDAFENSKQETSFFNGDGTFIINPSDVWLNGRTTSVTYEPGRTWGTYQAPVILDYIQLADVEAPATYTLTVGETLDLNDIITYTPANASMPYGEEPAFNVGDYASIFGWQEADPAVIHGTAATPAEGIEITWSYGEWEDQPMTIIIKEEFVPVTGITSNITGNKFLWVNGTDNERQLSLSDLYTITPANATNKAVTWKSSNEDVVALTTAATSGEIFATAKAVGSSTLTVTTDDGGYKVTYIIKVQAHVESIALSQQTFTMQRGTPIDMTSYVTVLPENAYSKTVHWSCTDADAFTINGSTLIPKKVGTFTLRVTSEENPDISTECTVLVEAAAAGVYAVNPVQEIWIGENADLNIYFEPADATSRIASWTSSDPNVVAITGDGVTAGFAATAKATGKSTLTVTTDNGQTATIEVTVKAHVERVQLGEHALTVDKGTTTSLDAQALAITPADAFDKSVTWAVADTSTVVTVNKSQDGKYTFTANRVGTATLKVTSIDNPQAADFLTVTVVSHPTSIKVDQPRQVLWIGDNADLGYTIEPSDATNKGVTWESSNTSVVAITQAPNGTVATATGVGTATLTATTVDGNARAQITIEVRAHVESLTLTESAIEIEIGTVKDLSSLVIIEPSNAYNRNVTWKSDDPQVVSVTGNVAQPNSIGMTTLTATSSDNPDLKATLTVTVIWKASSVFADQDQQDLRVGYPVNLSVYYDPPTATSVVTSWISSNPDVVAVTGDGVTSGFDARAIAPGSATLTATTDDGLSTTIDVNVYNTLQNISLSITDFTLEVGETLDLKKYITTDPSDYLYKLSFQYLTATGAGSKFSINNDGILTALASTKGNSYSAEIRATDGFYNMAQAYIKVTVTSTLTDIIFNSPEQKIQGGNEVNLTYYVKPDGADVPEEQWSSSDENVIRLEHTDKGWKAYGVNAGNATVTLTLGSVSKSIEVEVYTVVERIFLTTDSVQIKQEEKICLDDYIARLEPEDAADKSITWYADDWRIATVRQEDGKYYATGYNDGVTTLKAHLTANRNVFAEMTLTVTPIIKVFEARLPEQYVYTDTYVNMGVRIVPDQFANNLVTWECSDPDAVTYLIDETTGDKKAQFSKIGDFTLTGSIEGSDRTTTILVHVMKHVEAIELNISGPLTIKTGESLSLEGMASVFPSDAYNQELVWTMPSNRFANVTHTDDKWALHGYNPGTATLTVNSNDGSGVKASIEVVVIRPVTGIEAKEPEQFLFTGQYVNTNYTIQPIDASDETVTYRISDEDILHPEGEGKNFKIRAEQPGDATVTLVTNDGGYTTTIKATVVQPIEEFVLSADTLVLDINQTVDLNDYITAILPENAFNKEVYWETDKRFISLADDGHTATTINESRSTYVTIHAKYGSAKATIMVRVITKPKSIVVYDPEQTVMPGASVYLGFTVLPINSTWSRDDDVIWTTSDSTIVDGNEKNKNGLIIAKKLGTATLTVSMPKYGLSDSIHVTVAKAIEKIELTTYPIVLDLPATVDLNDYISIIPEDAYFRDVRWKYKTKDDEKYLAISSDGHTATTLMETPKPIGLIVQATMGRAEREAIVEIYIRPKSIVVDKPEQTIEMNKEIDLSYKVLPEGARYNPDDIVWTTTDREIVRVGHDAFDTHRTDDIHATSRKPGTATLTVSLPKENISDQITVTVLRPEVTSIYCEEIDVMKGETAKGIIGTYPEYSVIDKEKLEVIIVDNYQSWKPYDYTITADEEGNTYIELQAFTWGSYKMYLKYPNTNGCKCAIYIGQPIDLEKGWNWASIMTSSKPLSGYDAISLAFDGKLRDARTSSDLLYYNEQVGLFGTLQKFNASCYKIEVSDAVRFENERAVYPLFSGSASYYKQGWNWMWYPYDQDYTWDELKSIIKNAHKGDRIVAKNNGFVEYDGTKWEGSLNGLNASEGYMYYTAEKDGSHINWISPGWLPQKSQASQAAGRRTILNDEPVWQYNHRLFSDNMTIIATVSGLDFPDDCTIGAFVNGECRGEGRCINGKFFITVHGEGDEPVSFVIHDDITDSYYNVHGSLTFDTMIGTLEHPLPLKAGEKTTAIELPTSDIRTEGTGFYDLSGRRLISPAPGIHIVDGKLILIK